jgi:helix-turn-helix protein
MSLALLVVTAVLVEGRSKAEVGRDYWVSRRWVHELCRRFQAEGEVGLEPRSRRPRGSPHRIAVAMQLSGHLRALGRIIVPDGTRLCRARRTVLIQRFFSGRFRVVARGRSQLDGDYRIAVRDKAGRYRALVGQTLTPNHRCLPDVSLVRTHRHPAPPGGGGGGGASCTPGYFSLSPGRSVRLRLPWGRRQRPGLYEARSCIPGHWF